MDRPHGLRAGGRIPTSPGPTSRTDPSANSIVALPLSTTKTSSASVSVLTPVVCDHTPTSIPGATATSRAAIWGSPATAWSESTGAQSSGRWVAWITRGPEPAANVVMGPMVAPALSVGRPLLSLHGWTVVPGRCVPGVVTPTAVPDRSAYAESDHATTAARLADGGVEPRPHDRVRIGHAVLAGPVVRGDHAGPGCPLRRSERHQQRRADGGPRLAPQAAGGARPNEPPS